MKYPKFLNKDTYLHFVAPSFSCSIDPYKSRLTEGIKYFKSLNYKIIENDDIYSDFSPTIEHSKDKAIKINDAFNNDNDSILLSVGGGELMYQSLKYYNFDLFSERPKWFMGYSDNTILTFLLPTISNVASIYAVNSPDFGLNTKHQSILDTLSLLKGEKLSFESYESYEYTDELKHPLDGLILNKKTDVKSYPHKEVSFSGRIIGGCLDILLLFLGTKYDKVKEFSDKYRNDKIIWFFEACDLSIVAIRRALLQLKEVGWFNNTSGIIFGRPLNAYGDNFFGLTKDNVFIDILKDLDIPVIFDADIGHVKPSIPIICGSYASVNNKDGKFFINMKLI